MQVESQAIDAVELKSVWEEPTLNSHAVADVTRAGGAGADDGLGGSS